MLILTNCNQLRNSSEYLKNIGVEFRYANANVFTLVNFGPDVIISNDTEEMEKASLSNCNIKFVGPNLGFPNYNFNIPEHLLDELSFYLRLTNELKDSDIYYLNTGGIENYDFICKLRSLGNTKICGQGFCCDETIRNFPQRCSPAIYNKAKYGAASNPEEILKILFMGKPCISNINFDYCYHIDNIKDLSDIQGIDLSQINFAEQYSHANVWSTIFDLIGMEEERDKLKPIRGALT